MTKPKLVDADAVISQTMANLHAAANEMALDATETAAVESFTAPEEPAAEAQDGNGMQLATSPADTTASPPARSPLGYTSRETAVINWQMGERFKLKAERNEVAEQIAGLQAQQDDIDLAIARLDRGIGDVTV